jgi:hypothetical protein
MENQELQVVDQQTNYVPTLSMTPSMANQLIEQLDQLKKEVLRNKVDYDTIPGTPKPSLLKPGAERLLMCFGLGHRVHEVRVVEDWENGFFNYVYKVTIHKSYPTYEIVVAECIGSANSKESRYRDRWVFDSDARQMGLNLAELEKKQFKSKAGKPYYKYKVENPDPYTIVNTLQKMAIKRALVGATLQATGTSEFFTQDIEDFKSTKQTEQQRNQKQTQHFSQQQNKPQTLLNQTQTLILKKWNELGYLEHQLDKELDRYYSVISLTELTEDHGQEFIKILDAMLQEKKDSSSDKNRKRFFAIASKKELDLSEKQQKCIVFNFTGKESRSQLTEKEFLKINNALLAIKSWDDVQKMIDGGAEKKRMVDNYFSKASGGAA